MLSTKRTLIGIAFLGIGLMVLECLYLPVWREQGCLRDLTFVFIGRFVAWKSGPGQTLEIAGNVLLCHLTTLGITVLTAIIEARVGGCLENTKRHWFGALVCLFLISIFSLVPDLVPYALVLSALVFPGMLTRLAALFAMARRGKAGYSSALNRGIEQKDGSEAWYVGHLVEAIRKLSMPMRFIIVLGTLGMVFALILNIRAGILRDYKQEAASELDVSLLYTIRKRDIQRTERLLNRGANSNASGIQDESGEIFGTERCQVSRKVTALGIAIATGELPLIKLLIAHGADVHQWSWLISADGDIGKKPLTLAVESGHKEIVLYLLAQGADIDALNSDGSRVIDAAMAKPEMLKLLLDRYPAQK